MGATREDQNPNIERGNMTTENKADLLHGIAAIADHIGLSTRQAKHLHESEQMPTFKIGGRVCALKSKLDAWLVKKAGGAE